MENNLRGKEQKILSLNSQIRQLTENQEKIKEAVSRQQRPSTPNKQVSTRQLLNTLMIQNLMNKNQEVENT